MVADAAAGSLTYLERLWRRPVPAQLSRWDYFLGNQGSYSARRPPSMTSSLPVTKDDSSEAR